MIGPQFPDEVPAKVQNNKLRQFAALCLLIFGLLFAVNLYRHDGVPTALGWVALALATLIGIPGLIRPLSVRPVFLGAMAMTRPVGHLISLILLGVVYYLFLTPLAFIFRLKKRDVLNRRRPRAESYWTPNLQPVDPRRYLRQYQPQQTETSLKESVVYHESSESTPR